MRPGFPFVILSTLGRAAAPRRFYIFASLLQFASFFSYSSLIGVRGQRRMAGELKSRAKPLTVSFCTNPQASCRIS